VDAATATGEVAENTCLASSTSPAYTPTSSPVAIAYASVRLMIRSISYSLYFRMATPMPAGSAAIPARATPDHLPDTTGSADQAAGDERDERGGASRHQPVALLARLILIAFAIVGLIAVLGHRHGSFPITKEWFQLKEIGGKGSLAAGLLIAVFMYTGWDATIYVNEEVKHRRHNPGRAAVFAVSIVAVIFVLVSIGLAGVVSPAKLQANSESLLVYIAQVLGGSGWAKVMALALALSVIACTGVAVVILARMIYGMANHRVLPPVLGNVNTRFATPVVASVVVGVILIVITWVYLLSGSIANVFTQLIDVTGLLCAAYYMLTALAAIVYYRRRIFSVPWDAMLAGVLPAGAIAFLGWILVKSIIGAEGAQLWSLAGVGIAGIVLMLIARYVLRAQFFSTPRESAETRRS